jgi:hypothetical protein
MLYSIYFILFFCMDFGIAETGALHVVALLGLPPRCRESGFRPRKSGSFQRPAKFGSALVYTHLLRRVRELQQCKQAWRWRRLGREAAHEVEEACLAI